MTLEEWLSPRPKSANSELADSIGVSRQALWRYRSGERMPDAQVANRIVEATGGEVTIQDIHETRLAYLNKNGATPEAERPAA